MTAAGAATPAKTKVAVFDIDGTLCRSVAGHQRTLLRVMQGYAFPALRTDWASYAEHTGSWIFAEAYEEAHRRPPDPGEVSRFGDTFSEAFLVDLGAEPVEQVAGAAAFLPHLLHRTEWAIALATGSIREPAAAKLQRAGIDGGPAPMVTSSEFRRRGEIVEGAVARARDVFSMGIPERVVSVGDGRWDLDTADRLGLPFLGVDGDGKGDVLRKFGARVIPDFTSVNLALEELETCRAADAVLNRT